jgi:hypothetical protein
MLMKIILRVDWLVFKLEMRYMFQHRNMYSSLWVSIDLHRNNQKDSAAS